MCTHITESHSSWQEVAARRRQATINKIKPEWILPDSVLNEIQNRRAIVGGFIESLLDDETQRFTGMDVPELCEGILKGSFNSTQIVTAFCKRAAIAHQLNRNLLDVGFDQAISRAQKLDEYYENHQTVVGPLHGIPITLKDQFHVKGMETTMGYVGWIGTFEGRKNTGKEQQFESELVRELIRLGAVPIAKTSLVTSLWAPETNNHISGYVWNPYNTLLSAGGSSGGKSQPDSFLCLVNNHGFPGEGALQALGGSPIGFGTDIGGSVSMPACYNGLFSLKPSAGRLPFKGVANSGAGQQVMPTVIGIIGHSIAAIHLVFESLLSVQPWLYDPYTLPIPYRCTSDYKSCDMPHLNLGFMEHDGVVRPHPPIARALRMVKTALEREGHNVIPWRQLSPDEATDIHTAISRGDGCMDVWENLHLSGEPPVPEIEYLFPGGKPIPSISSRDHGYYCDRMKKYRESYMDYWNSTSAETDNGLPAEAVILPVTPHAAVLPGKSYYFGYNCFINVLDYTSVVIPVTFANRDLDIIDPSFEPLTVRDKSNMSLYNAETYHGAPAGIQVMGRRLDEEKLLEIASYIGGALERYKATGGKGWNDKQAVKHLYNGTGEIIPFEYS
ncbi:amidase [Annulohypoxylon moriforme]|nr:amidase [Annulohypoxylon moriforme]